MKMFFALLTLCVSIARSEVPLQVITGVSPVAAPMEVNEQRVVRLIDSCKTPSFYEMSTQGTRLVQGKKSAVLVSKSGDQILVTFPADGKIHRKSYTYKPGAAMLLPAGREGVLIWALPPICRLKLL